MLRILGARAKDIAIRHLLVQELVKVGKFNTHYVKMEDHFADLGTKHINKHRHRYLINLINEFKA